MVLAFGRIPVQGGFDQFGISLALLLVELEGDGEGERDVIEGQFQRALALDWQDQNASIYVISTIDVEMLTVHHHHGDFLLEI